MGNGDKKVPAVLLVVWGLLALFLIVNPLVFRYWFWLENIFGFLLASLTFLIIQLRTSQLNLGVVLAAGYFTYDLVITLIELHQPSEQGWGWIMVFLLGMPSNLLNGVPIISDLISCLNNSTLEQGVSFAIFGSVQYFLIGFFLEKTYKAIRKSHN
ncbi:MAG TPA: hypothetical protein VHE12_11150 [bacterium]|nr:hypothetical protein [bacterium]